jgi:hypothetical protein
MVTLIDNHHFLYYFRYGLIEGDKEKFNLYTISIPVKRSQNPLPCYLAMWDSSKFTPKRMVSTGQEVLSALALRFVFI